MMTLTFSGRNASRSAMPPLICSELCDAAMPDIELHPSRDCRNSQCGRQGDTRSRQT